MAAGSVFNTDLDLTIRGYAAGQLKGTKVMSDARQEIIGEDF